MPRATNSPASRERKRKMQKLAKGFFGLRRNGNRNMQETVVRGLVYQYRDRRNKKRSFRACGSLVSTSPPTKPAFLTTLSFPDSPKPA